MTIKHAVTAAVTADGEHVKAPKWLRHVAPWFIGLVVMPITIWWFRLMWAGDLALYVAAFMLLMVGAGLTGLSYHRSHSRSSWQAKWIGPAYTAIPMAFLALATLTGLGPIPDGVMFVLWLIGTLGSCLAWNLYFAKRSEGEAVTFDLPKTKVDKAAITAAALATALPPGTGPAALPDVDGEVISETTETTPLHPEVAKALAKVSAEKALMEARAAAAAADANARRVIGGWRELVGFDPASQKARGPLKFMYSSSLKLTRNEPYCTELRLRLGDGIEPEALDNARGKLAAKFRVGRPDVRIIPNKKDHGDVRLRVVWFNPLEATIHWQGPRHPGIWWGSEPIVFAKREDNTDGRLLLPSSKKHGKPNSSHVLVEGVNGAGKSEAMLVVAGEGCTQQGVSFFGIDIGKVLQTFGPIMPAINWMATDRVAAKMMIKAIIEVGLQSRGALFGRLGAKEWSPELAKKYGIPYIVIFIEEGGLIFEALGRDITKVLMLARSLGVCIWGSIQRAQHENMDTNARAQFTEVMTFGMTSDADVFGMPEWLMDMGASPEQWGSSLPGMHYHHTALLARDDQSTPQRSMLTDAAMLRQVTEQYGPNMMQPEPTFVNAINSFRYKTKGEDEEIYDLYDRRETGMDVERRLKAAGGIALDDRETVEAITGGEIPQEEAGAALHRGEELRAAGMVPPMRERESVTLTRRNPYDTAPAKPQPHPDEDDPDLVGPEEEEEERARQEALAAEDNGEAEIVQLGKELVYMPGKNGQPDRIVDGEGEELELDDDFDDEDDDDGEDDDLDIDDALEGDDEDGFADDEHAATSKPLAKVLWFDDDDDDFEPSDSREGAERNLLRVLAADRPGHVFQTGDYYDHPEIPYVGKSKSWLRGSIIKFAEQGYYIELINDPGSDDDGKYRTTQHIAEVRRPAPLAVVS